MDIKVDKQDLEILRILQSDSRLPASQISRKTGILTTTVYAKIKRMEKLGIIKGYCAILDAKKIGKKETALILVSFSYRPSGEKVLSQREIAKKIAMFPEVQEVHIITGEWDMLVKVKEKDVDSVGNFVVDKLRKLPGVDKVVTSMVFATEKESLGIEI